MDLETVKSTVWLGQKIVDRKMDLGDFGFVNATIKADAFQTPTGYMIHLYSCELHLFGSTIEFMHRLTTDAREQLKISLLSEVSNSEKSHLVSEELYF